MHKREETMNSNELNSNELKTNELKSNESKTNESTPKDNGLILHLFEPEQASKYKNAFNKGEVSEVVLHGNLYQFIKKLLHVLEWDYQRLWKDSKPVTKLTFKISLGSEVTSVANLFAYCEYLQEVPFFDTSRVTDFTRMFCGCSSLEKIPNYDFSHAKWMDCLFQCCAKLKVAPIINAHMADSLAACFYDCPSLESVPVLEMPNVTSTYSMFLNCGSLKTLPLLECPKLDCTDEMFQGCVSLTSVHFSPAISPSSVKNMFNWCESLYEFPEIHLEKLVDTVLFNRFDLCDHSGLLNNYPYKETLVLHSHYNRRKKYWNYIKDYILRNDFDRIIINEYSAGYGEDIKKAIPIFAGLKELVSLDCDIVIGPKITDCSEFFKGCSNLRYIKSLTIQGVLHNTNSMFKGCKSLESVPYIDLSMVRDSGDMFAGCTLLKKNRFKNNPNNSVDNSGNFENFGDLGNFEKVGNSGNLEISDVKRLHVENRDNAVDTDNTVSTDNVVHANNVRPYNIMPLDENNNQVNTLQNMLEPAVYTVRRCESSDTYFMHHLIRRILKNDLEEIKIAYNLLLGGAQTSPFAEYKSLKVLNFKISFTKNVTCCCRLFSGMKELTYVKEVDTSGIKKFMHMFKDCVSLEEAPEIDTSNAEIMDRMFYGCKNLKYIPMLNMANVRSMKEIFKGCNNLE